MHDEPTYTDKDGVAHLERRECVWHEHSATTIKNHDIQLRNHEVDIQILKTQNVNQNILLNEIKETQKRATEENQRFFNKLDTKMLVIAGGIIVYLLNQLLPTIFIGV